MVIEVVAIFQRREKAAVFGTMIQAIPDDWPRRRRVNLSQYLFTGKYSENARHVPAWVSLLHRLYNKSSP